MTETYSPPAHILAADVLPEDIHKLSDASVNRLRGTKKLPSDEDSLEFQVVLVLKVIGYAILESDGSVWERPEEVNIKALLEDEEIQKAVHHASKKREYQLIRNLGSCCCLVAVAYVSVTRLSQRQSGRGTVLKDRALVRDLFSQLPLLNNLRYCSQFVDFSKRSDLKGEQSQSRVSSTLHFLIITPPSYHQVLVPNIRGPCGGRTIQCDGQVQARCQQERELCSVHIHRPIFRQGKIAYRETSSRRNILSYLST